MIHKHTESVRKIDRQMGGHTDPQQEKHTHTHTQITHNTYALHTYRHTYKKLDTDACMLAKTQLLTQYT